MADSVTASSNDFSSQMGGIRDDMKDLTVQEGQNSLERQKQNMMMNELNQLQDMVKKFSR